MSYAAEARLLTGDLVGAQRDFDAALGLCSRIGERLMLPDLEILQAKIAIARDDAA